MPDEHGGREFCQKYLDEMNNLESNQISCDGGAILWKIRKINLYKKRNTID